jgi:hypothetical protein
LLRSWSFQDPSFDDLQVETAQPNGPPSPSLNRRPTFSFSHTRRQSVTIDMDMPSEPASPGSHPKLANLPEIPPPTEGDLPARKVGLGRLIQAVKQEEKAAVPEFDMGAFGF